MFVVCVCVRLVLWLVVFCLRVVVFCCFGLVCFSVWCV